jgi:hypothetical protein
MRIISTFFLFFLTISCFAHPGDTSKVVITGNCWAKKNTNSLSNALAGRMGCGIVSAEKKDTSKKTGRFYTRCAQSFSNDTNPLIVVDGLPVESK